MITHTTDSGIVYEINLSPEEARARVARLICALWPTYLELQAERSRTDGSTGREPAAEAGHDG